MILTRVRASGAGAYLVNLKLPRQGTGVTHGVCMAQYAGVSANVSDVSHVSLSLADDDTGCASTGVLVHSDYGMAPRTNRGCVYRVRMCNFAQETVALPLKGEVGCAPGGLPQKV